MSELIDRQAFIENERKLYCEDCDRRKGKKDGKLTVCYEIGEAPCRSCWLDDALTDLEDFPAASPWHRVEDGLPEEDVEVLISYRYKEGEGDTSHVDIDITSYGQMYFGGREVAGVKHWRPPFEYFSSNYEVIAWMPLPEPPKEDA